MSVVRNVSFEPKAAATRLGGKLLLASYRSSGSTETFPELLALGTLIAARCGSVERRRVQSGSPGGAMATYRIYCLDNAGHIRLADWLESSTDDDAIAQARKLRPDAQKCELWFKDRLIARINGEGHLVRVDA